MGDPAPVIHFGKILPEQAVANAGWDALAGKTVVVEMCVSEINAVLFTIKGSYPDEARCCVHATHSAFSAFVQILVKVRAWPVVNLCKQLKMR